MKKVLFAFLLLTVVIYCQKNKLLEESKLISINSQKNIPFSLIENGESNKKNPALAILYSALMPGMGELYAGDYSFGKYLTIAETAFWGIYLGMNSYGNWKMDNYKAYAKTYAGVNLEGKDADYFASIGEFRSIDQYNDDKALSRRFEEMYNIETDSWKWQTESERKAYRNMWLSSQHAFNNTRFVVGAMILNRLVSIINAVRVTAAHNRNLSNEINVYFDADPFGNSISSFNVNFMKSF